MAGRMGERKVERSEWDDEASCPGVSTLHVILVRVAVSEDAHSLGDVNDSARGPTWEDGVSSQVASQPCCVAGKVSERGVFLRSDGGGERRVALAVGLAAGEGGESYFLYT